MAVDARTRVGQAVYTPLTLALYDGFVLGFSNRFLWRCPTAGLRALYDRNVSARHLDIGVGTGYFLDRARFPVAAPSVTLLDLNPHSLQAAARRIARYRPRTIEADVFAPLPPGETYDSVGMNYLLHCLPGPFAHKAQVFDNVLPVLAPGARVFGTTILGDAAPSAAARALMGFYNRKGVFANAGDRLDELHDALDRRFDDVRLTCVGAVALFEARQPA